MRAASICVPVFAALALSACSSIHLYNKDSDQIATDASVKYAESKIGDTLKQQRVIVNALEQKEVEAFRKLTVAQRDLELLALMESPEIVRKKPTAGRGFAARFSRTVNDRLTYLDGVPEERQSEQQKARKAKVMVEGAAAKEAMARAQLLGFDARAKLPVCSESMLPLSKDDSGREFLKLSGADSEFASKVGTIWIGMRPIVQNLVEHCMVKLAAEKQFNSFKPVLGGMLKVSMDDLAKREAARSAVKAHAEEAKGALLKAGAELARATKDRTAQLAPRDFTCPEPKPKDAPAPAPDAAAGGAAAMASNEMCRALAQLKALGDSGIRIVAEEKIKRIGAVLSAVSGVASETGDTQIDEPLALIAATTRLGHALDRYNSAGELPALEPLIIEKQLAEVELAYASAGLRLEQSRVSNARELVEAIQQEISMLGEASTTIKGLGKLPPDDDTCMSEPLFCASVESMLASSRTRDGVPVQRTAYRAMTLLSESHSVARDRQQTAEIRLAAADYQESLIRSEAAVASWKAIIDTPVEQLKSYHAGGLRPEVVAALLQAVGIVGIAIK